MLAMNKITPQEMLTIGANLIGKPTKPLDLIHDGMLVDITEARESYFTDELQYENLGKIVITIKKSFFSNFFPIFRWG